ncbi:MAG: response regulator transcription factor [Bacteroidetes bacterium]|nr:response regulator transcription factor [Bacteroidota bacterium]
MKPISVYLVDDHKIIVDGIQSLLDGDPRFVVCGFTTDSRFAVQEILALKPDIVISDIQMPEVSGKEIVTQIAKLQPLTKVLTLSMLGDAGAISELLEAGASGYLLKIQVKMSCVKHSSPFTVEKYIYVLQQTLSSPKLFLIVKKMILHKTKMLFI